MAASTDLTRRTAFALAGSAAAVEQLSALNTAILLAATSTVTVPLAIVATAVSTTTNFAALGVNDLVMILPAVAGNAQFVTCAVAGTLPQAAVVGSLYVALRAFTAPAAPVVAL